MDLIHLISVVNDQVLIKNDPIIRVKFETSQRTMTEDTSLSWEDYLKRKDSTGSPGDDQIIIPIMWFKQTARMQWSFYKNMLLSGNVHFLQ